MILEGRVAIVTGGTQAAGPAHVHAFAREGAKVVIADRFPDLGRQIVAEVEQAGGTASYIDFEFTDESSAKAVAAHAADTYGGLDILVNNAATYGNTSFCPMSDMSVEQWDNTMAVYVKSPFLMCKAALPYLTKSSHASIIHQTSVAAYGVRNWLDYGTARGAVIAMTKSMAMELAAVGIRVNAIVMGSMGIEAVALGVVKDESMMTSTPDFKRQLIQRLGTGEDVAGMALYLASDASSYVTGQSMVMDGGKYFPG